MFALDPVFNAMSSAPLAGNRHEAWNRVSKLISVLVAAPEKGLGRALRASEDFRLLPLAEDYTLDDWLSDPEVSREEKTFLLTLATKMPVLDGIPDPVGEKTEVTEVSCDGKVCPNFLAAYLLEVPVISLNHDKWSAATLETKVQFLDDEGELIETEREQINLSQEEHFSIHGEWIVTRLKRNIESMEALWEKREELFPNLVFCESVENQLLPMSPGADSFTLVISRLFDLERVSQITPFNRDAFESQCNPSSPQTLTDYEQDYTFVTPEGEQVICGWHLYLPNGQRIYFSIKNNQITIGHIGEHLPTKRFPK